MQPVGGHAARQSTVRLLRPHTRLPRTREVLHRHLTVLVLRRGGLPTVGGRLVVRDWGCGSHLFILSGGGRRGPWRLGMGRFDFGDLFWDERVGREAREGGAGRSRSRGRFGPRSGGRLEVADHRARARARGGLGRVGAVEERVAARGDEVGGHVDVRRLQFEHRPGRAGGTQGACRGVVETEGAELGMVVVGSISSVGVVVGRL